MRCTNRSNPRVMSMPSHRQTWSANNAERARDSENGDGLARQWLIGAVTALSAIAVWALVVWLGVLIVQASGLLPQSVQP